MKNNKRTTPIFLAFLLLLFIFAGLPGTSIFANGPAGKDLKQQKNPYANAEITFSYISGR
jgi:hypothetical protein